MNKAPEKRTKEDQCADFFYGLDTKDLPLDSAVYRGLFWLGHARWQHTQLLTEKFGSN
jgi:hypothetical protein